VLDGTSPYCAWPGITAVFSLITRPSWKGGAMSTGLRLIAIALLAPTAVRAQKIDVANHSITCNTVIATVSNSPPLVIGGTATSEKMTVKGSLAGCTVTGQPAITILSGKLRGRVASTSNECIVLAAPLTGSITMKWKADKATPILQTSSTIGITDVTFGGFAAPWGSSYGQFSLGTSSVTGAFTGGDGGAASSNVSLTSQDLVEIVAECASAKGLKTLNIGSGQVKLQ
jgi:hypothetical protein